MTPAEARKASAEALRSGEFKQGRGLLESANNEFCCLGVACQVAIRHGVAVSRSLNTNDDRYYYRGSAIGLPKAVQAWLGYHSLNPMLSGADAWDRNDHLKQSFAEIADAIDPPLGT